MLPVRVRRWVSVRGKRFTRSSNDWQSILAIFFRKTQNQGCSCVRPPIVDQANIVLWLRKPHSDLNLPGSDHTMFVSYALCFLLALVLHELGHFAAARACRVTITEFGVGWGGRFVGMRV